MINKDFILSKLPPFLNQQNIVVENQDVKDIINGILYTHDKYAKDYDKISDYFQGSDINETSQNIFNFLKRNIRYKAESENRQMLKSPASFLSTGIGDCKSYALFINGINDSLRRKYGYSYDLKYRFASYDPFNKTPQHVFAVIKDAGNELWVDPVLNYFNQKKQPYYFQDKKIKNMSLISLAGIEQGFSDGYVSGTPTIAGGFQDALDSILKSAPSILNTLQPRPAVMPQTQNTGFYTPPPPVTPNNNQSTGISTNTLLLIGAVGLGAYFLLKK
jgi:hypothetical protein